MKAFALILLSFFPAACASVAEADRPRIVRDDFGGPLVTRYQELEKLEKDSRPIQIRGKCASACTLYIGLPQACVSKNALIGFHGPSSPFLLPLPKEEFEEDSRKMASFYPPALAKWFLEEGRHKIMDDLTWFRGADLERYGVRVC